MKRVLFLIVVILLSCCVTGIVLADPPANDDCADAVDIGTLELGVSKQTSGTTVDATQDCSNLIGAEVWVKFTLEQCMDITIDFCDDQDYSMEASDYLSTECPCGEMISFNEATSCPSKGNPLRIWYNLAAGTYYYPIVPEEDGGTYTINITGEDCPSVPVNDDCADAIAINEVSKLEFSGRMATHDNDGDCITENPNIWYVYTPTFTGSVRFDFYGSEFIPQLTVYDSYSCSPLPTVLSCVEQWQLDISVVADQQYLIEIGIPEDQLGDGMLSIYETPTAPPNDDCADADDAGMLEYDVPVQMTGTTVEATNDCDDNVGDDVWVKFTVPSCMDITIDFCDNEDNLSMFSQVIYTECPCAGGISLDELDYCEGSYNVQMTWLSVEAGTYFYPIIKYSSGGSYTVNILGETCAPLPTGACCLDNGMQCTDDVEELTCIYELGGYWKGEGSECGEYDSETGYAGCETTSEYGACCTEDGMECYSDIDQYECEYDFYGTWMGPGTECGVFDEDTGYYTGCSDDVSTGACCYQDGSITECVETDEATCYDEYEGTWMGYGTDCTDSDENEIADVCEEPSTGACCYQDGSITECVETDEATCYDEYEGTWMGYGTDCTDSDENEIADICEEPDTYNYLPGDANMAAETWPAQTIGGDVTYLVNYFRGLADPCNLDGFYASADATGDCLVVGGDVTYLVNYFRGLADMSYCSDYEPEWPTPSDVPTDAPDGWPNCD